MKIMRSTAVISRFFSGVIGLALLCLPAIGLSADEDVQFRLSATSVNEQAGTVNVELELISDIDQVINVMVSTQDDSALTNLDYYGFFQTLVFGPRQRRQPLTLTLIDDSISEGVEGFYLLIRDTRNNSVSQHRIEIVDNDSVRPTLTIEDAKTIEAVSRVAVKIRLDPAAAETVTVLVRSDGDSAAGGQDFLDIWQVISFSPGETEKDVTIAIINDTAEESDEMFKVLLTNPTTARIGRAVATVVIQDDGDGQTPVLQVLDNQVFETAGVALIALRVTPPATEWATVELRTRADSAQPGEDYRDVYQVVRFQPGDMIKYLSIPLINDEVIESIESFEVLLSNPTGIELSTKSLKVSIADDDTTDRYASFALDAKSINESQQSLEVEVSLSDALATQATVRVSTLADTALPGQDFSPVSSIVTFAPGEQKKLITISLINDTESEANEALTVALSEADGATIATSTLSVPIFDDDVANELSLSIADVTVREDDLVVDVLVTLSAKADASVRVNVQTHADSALVPMDYYEVYESIEFAPGETEKSVTITLIDDYQVENQEQLFVQLSDPQGARIEKAQAAITIEDNDQY